MSNILVTGAAGYIGGSLVADFLASKSSLIQRSNIFAAVRSQEQADALTQTGVKVLQFDLNDKSAVKENLLQHQINIVIHTSSSLNSELAFSLIDALSEQQSKTGHRSHFIHTSGEGAFYESAGWPYGKIKDTEDVFERVKQCADTFPIRKTDVDVTEHAKSRGVTSFIVVPTLVFGKGNGAWNKLSVLLPVVIRASLSQKSVSKFAENTTISAINIHDLTNFYERLVLKILLNEQLPNGTEGYYFAKAFTVEWWEILDKLASTLYARGLATQSETMTWTSHEAAADALGIPLDFVKVLWNSSTIIIAEKKKILDWVPSVGKEQMLEGISDEIDAVLEQSETKSSLIGSMKSAGSG